MTEPDRHNQVTRALLALRSLLTSGQVAAGTRLSEVALSERIGISRTPLREALLQLGAEGLIARGETGGWLVRRFTLADVIDAIELRGVAEGTALRLSAERGPLPAPAARARDLLERLEATLGATAPQTDFDAYVTLNAEFHQALTAMCPAPLARDAVAHASQLPMATPSAFIEGQSDVTCIRLSLITAQAQHRAMLEAVENREGARAESLAREHARLARTNLEYMLSKDPGLVRRVPGIAMVDTRQA